MKLDSIAPGDQFRVTGAYSDDAGSFAAGPDNVGWAWIAVASFQHYWQSNLSSAVSFKYADDDDSSGGWSGAANLVYSPVHNFSVGGEVVYSDPTDSWAGKIRLQRDFGG